MNQTVTGTVVDAARQWRLINLEVDAAAEVLTAPFVLLTCEHVRTSGVHLMIHVETVRT